MRCVPFLLLAVAVAGCGASGQSGALGSSSSSTTSPTTASVAATSSSESSSGPPGAWGDAGITCNVGREGCPCGEADACLDDLVCDGDRCRRVVLCGDGRVDSPESCDDGNTASEDGCSGVCQWERHCWVGWAGDDLGTLRTLSFQSDGQLHVEAARTVGIHQPAAQSLARSVRRCGSRAFFVSPGSGLVQSVEGLGAPDSPGVAVDGALELACAQASQLLFVTAQTEAGFEVHLIDAADGGLVLLDVASVEAQVIPRMAVDETTDRLWLALPGAPLQLLPLGYAGLVLDPEDALATDREVPRADDFLWLPSVAAGIMVSRAPNGQVVGVSVDAQSWSLSNGPWEDRSGIEPLDERYSVEAFAMGGVTGVRRGRLDETGEFFGVGPELASDLGDTFVRTAMDGRRILIATSAELRILAPQQVENSAFVWEELDRVLIPGWGGFESAAVIPCP